jgi:hypothetical protein
VGGRPALEDTRGGDRAVALPDGKGIGPGGRTRAAEPIGAGAESRAASGRLDRIASSHASRRARAPATEASRRAPPAARTELLHVLTLPDFDLVEGIGEFWSYPQSRSSVELLIDCEEDRTHERRSSGSWRDMERGEAPSSGRLPIESLVLAPPLI